jgi:aerobic carbon-monoxide dehydrogenase large subunit
VAERWVGRPVRRVEDDRLLRGDGRFVADLSRLGQLHAHFVRSPLARARIASIDASKALQLPGVAGVYTHEHVPAGPMPPFLWDSPPAKLVGPLRPHLRPCHPPLLPADEARFAGQAVAVVLAEDRYLAEDAAELVEVDYEPLDAVTGAGAALGPDAPLLHPGWDSNVAVRFEVRKGDAAAAIARADLVVRERFEVQRQAGLPIETRGALADWDRAAGSLTLWSSTQNAHPLRRALSRVAGLDPGRVRVVAPDVGGGFGVKGVLYPEDLLVGLLAMRTGRPVKWIEDRAEHLRSAIHAREQVHEIELGLTRDGEVVAIRDHILVDCGAFNPLGLVIPYNTIAHLMGPYRVPNLEAVATGVVTNKVPTAPYRGAGRPEAVFAVERALELAARALDADPLELRLRNLVGPDELPYGAGILYRDGEPLVLDSGDYPRALRRAAELAGYAGVRAAPAEAGRRPVGVGLACYVEGTGIGPFEGAAVAVGHDGRVTVRTGACSQGQGHATVLAQVCADHLGVAPEDVTVVGGDTAGIERGWGTVASRSAVVAGSAVAAAAAAVRERALEIAGDLLEAAPADLQVQGNRVVVAGAPERGLELGEVARAAEAAGAPVAATEYFEPPTVTWANGAHAAVVEVDPDTGEVRVLRYAVVHDCGRVINPVIVDGQVRGGVAQGLGGALYEELTYDDDGQLTSGTLADYLVPTAGEVPRIDLEHLETPSPLNPLGLKGVGEGGAIPVPAAIANAVEHALGRRCSGPAQGGPIVRRTPLSPASVRALIEG